MPSASSNKHLHARPKVTKKGEERNPLNKFPEVATTYAPIALWRD